MNDKGNDRQPSMRHADTTVVTAGRDPESYHGFVNPPVYHASTVLYPNAEDFLAHRARYQYGRRGTPTTEALELALQELEGPQCAGVALLPSGLAAISAALLSVAHAGDHLLVTDSAYGPTRNFCGQILSRLGITTSYYDPLIGGAIGDLIRPNTRVVYLESPGSLSFEMQDTSAIAKAAHDKGAVVIMDNTWATPLYFRPLDHGVDLVIQAGTKYIGGHSDVMLGTVSANAATVAALQNMVRLTGLHEAPDDIYLVCAACARSLCGLSGIINRAWPSPAGSNSGRKSCACCIRHCRVIQATRYGSAISAAPPDFSAWCSNRCRRRRTTPSSTRSNYSASAPSWGGYESLAIPFDCTPLRTATQWRPAVRLYAFISASKRSRILIADLERGFAALAAAG